LIGSHRGGTGKTTTAAALAGLWSRAGRPLIYGESWPLGLAPVPPASASSVAPAKPAANASPVKPAAVNSAHASAANKTSAAAQDQGPSTSSVWPVDEEAWILVDAPPLADPAARGLLRRADGVLLTCRADVLSLQTISAAEQALRTARTERPQLVLLGILLTNFREDDPWQQAAREHFQQNYPQLLLDPPIPHQLELSRWPARPELELPHGPARDAYFQIAAQLAARLPQIVVPAAVLPSHTSLHAGTRTAPSAPGTSTSTPLRPQFPRGGRVHA